jgi:ParB-like chromosome segregation protein Spo0J
MLRWSEGGAVQMVVDELGDSYARYRLGSIHGERAMRQSLERYGQLSAVVGCRRGEVVEVLDGFKRVAAARELSWERVSVRFVDADERGAKAAIFGLNQVGGRTQELEEAWIIHALVREDGMSQVEVAELLGRHKSWVCRRLALLERLCPEAKEDLRLGVLTPTMGRELVRLPQGNQPEVVEVIERESLTRSELQGLVDLVLGCSDEEQRRFVLQHPRDALTQAYGAPRTTPADPRLSPAGNRLAKRLGLLQELLARMEGWLGSSARGELTAHDRALLAPAFVRVARSAAAVAEMARDFVAPAGNCS